MKSIFTFLVFAIFVAGVNAQYQLPVDFEADQSDTVWAQFANAGDAPENFLRVENPYPEGINTSGHCIKFTVMPTAYPWVGAWSDAYQPVVIESDRYMMQMMVFKDVITNCCWKRVPLPTLS
jgi:hypothetical protein